MHRTSFGRNVPVNTSTNVGVLQIPNFTREGLIQRALADWKDHHDAEYRLSHKKTSVERKCFEYIRHRQTSLSSVLTRVYGAAYLLAVRQFCDAVSDRYDWLRDECNRYYDRKAHQSQHSVFRVVKRPSSVTSLQVADINERESLRPETPITEEEEIPAFFNLLSSLDQERFLYLPPFLKPNQVKERRFGDNANDRWWEWEQELGLQSDIGRPDQRQGLIDNFGQAPVQKSGAWGNRVKR